MKNEIAVIGRIKVFERDGKHWTTSLNIAEVFGKEHGKIIRDIENLECSQGFNQANFGLIDYVDSRGRTQPMYELTRDGFSFLVMGFTGAKAAQFKEAYIEAFNQMEQHIKSENIQEMIPGLSAVMISMQRFIDSVHATREENQREHIQINTKILAVDEKIGVVSEKVDRVEQKLDGVIEMSKQRCKVSASDSKTHISYLFYKRHGVCPCCETTQIIDDCMNPVSGYFEMDHFFNKTRNKLDETWPICKQCNGKRANGGNDHNDVEGCFTGYQSGLRTWRKKRYEQIPIGQVVAFR